MRQMQRFMAQKAGATHNLRSSSVRFDEAFVLDENDSDPALDIFAR